MNSPMPCSATAAERLADRPDPALAFLGAALERAVELVMSGEPSNAGFPSVDMDAFLDACVPEREQTRWFVSMLCAPSTDELVLARGEIAAAVERRLRDWLTGSEIVQNIAARMAEAE